MWMPPVHQQQKESMLCQTEGVSICLYTFGCPHMFGHPHMSGCPSYLWMPPYIWRHPNIQWGSQTYRGVSKHMGHPNVWAAYGHPLSLTKHAFFIVDVQRASTCMGAYGHPLSLTKHAFFVLCLYREHPNIWGPLNIWGCPSIQGTP